MTGPPSSSLEQTKVRSLKPNLPIRHVRSSYSEAGQERGPALPPEESLIGKWTTQRCESCVVRVLGINGTENRVKVARIMQSLIRGGDYRLAEVAAKR